jgi:hypothetical protein
VPGAGDDLDFFCSDWSNELLVAAGVRNDSGDYFKVSDVIQTVAEFMLWVRGKGITAGLHLI